MTALTVGNLQDRDHKPQQRPAEDASPIDQAVVQLANEIGALTQQIQVLSTNLAPVLAPGEIPPPAPPGVAPGSSPICNDLTELSHKVNYINAIVADILKRLEV